MRDVENHFRYKTAISFLFLLIYTIVIILLFISFPKTMITLYALFWVVLWFTVITTSYNNVLYKDLVLNNQIR